MQTIIIRILTDEPLGKQQPTIAIPSIQAYLCNILISTSLLQYHRKHIYSSTLYSQFEEVQQSHHELFWKKDVNINPQITGPKKIGLSK